MSAIAKVPCRFSLRGLSVTLPTILFSKTFDSQ
jgi:hypothetical protein